VLQEDFWKVVSLMVEMEQDLVEKLRKDLEERILAKIHRLREKFIKEIEKEGLIGTGLETKIEKAFEEFEELFEKNG
jgi:hypothetical protein